MVPKGNYLTRANTETCELVMVGKEGDKKICLNVGFAVMNPETKARELVFKNFYFTSATEVRTMQGLRYMGWQGTSLRALKEEKFASLATNEVDVEVEIQEYDGKQTARVNWVNRPGMGPSVAPSADQLDALDLRFAEVAKKVDEHGNTIGPRDDKAQKNLNLGGPVNGNRPAAASHKPVMAEDDDIPF